MEQGPKSPSAHSRTFSYRSDKSSSSKNKEETAESAREKQFRDSFFKGGHKSNPNNAINEAQPGVKAILEETTIIPLRGIQHKDAQGNLITDPDLSNPTRHRLERPLDTIRSFEKNIDNGYKRRSNNARSESYNAPESQYGGSRRNSAYGYDTGASRPPTNGGGYYGGSRPDSYFSSGPSGPPRRQGVPRMQSDSAAYGQGAPKPYPHGYQQSQDTVNTGLTHGSDSTGPWANSTDPSSENSSIDRGPAGSSGYPQSGYGQSGYGSGGFQGPIMEEGGGYPIRNGGPGGQLMDGERRPIPLGNSSTATTNLPSTKRPEPEKRQSWIKRRFSKNN